MTHHPEEQQRQRAQDIALFRYALVREASDEKLSKQERGRIVRSLAEVFRIQWQDRDSTNEECASGFVAACARQGRAS